MVIPLTDSIAVMLLKAGFDKYEVNRFEFFKLPAELAKVLLIIHMRSKGEKRTVRLVEYCSGVETFVKTWLENEHDALGFDKHLRGGVPWGGPRVSRCPLLFYGTESIKYSGRYCIVIFIDAFVLI